MKKLLNRIKKFTTRGKGCCPKKEELAAFFLAETSREKKFKLMDHIASCPQCGIEFKILKTIWERGDSLFDPETGRMLEIANPDQVSSIAKKELRALAGQKGPRQRMALTPFRAASLAAALVVVILIISFVWLYRPPQVILERSLDTDTFQVLEPWDSVGGYPVIFRWAPVSESKKYALEILDSGLEVVYREENISTTSFELPDNLTLQLSKSKTYFWKVIATLDDGRTVESEFGKFRISGN